MNYISLHLPVSKLIHDKSCSLPECMFVILGIILYVILFQPLFLYLPFQAVHSGNLPSGKYLQAPTKYIKKFPHIQNTQRRTYAGKDHITKMKHRGISLHKYIYVNTFFYWLQHLYHCASL